MQNLDVKETIQKIQPKTNSEIKNELEESIGNGKKNKNRYTRKSKN